jgi:hypothetical protein
LSERIKKLVAGNQRLEHILAANRQPS